MVGRKRTRRKSGAAQAVPWIELFAGTVVLVDPKARVLARNRAADHLFSRSGIVRIEGGRLRVSCNGNQNRIDALIGRAMDVPERSHHARLRRVENGEAVSVNARRLEPGILLFLSDGHVAIGQETRQHMQDLWGLSEVEARVAAAVVEGVELKAYAEEHAVSPHTVRTQLNMVFAKTGAGRQADLVRLVLSGPAYIAEDPHDGD